MHFWLCCVFVAAGAFLQLLGAGAALRCSVGFPCCRGQALGPVASGVVARGL